MNISPLLCGLIAVSLMGGACAAAETEAPPVVTPSSVTTETLQNDYVALTVQMVGGKLVNATLQDKLNGLSYDLGPDIFALDVQKTQPDEACSKQVVLDELLHLNAAAMLPGHMTKEEIKAAPNARRLVERSGGTRLNVPFPTLDNGLQVTWWAEVRDGHPYARVGVTLTAEQGAIPARRITLLDLAAPDARVEGTVKGAPVIASGNRLFAGIENPMSVNEAKNGRVSASINRKTDLPARAPVTVSAVLGVSNPTQLRRTFQLAYLNEERARPYAPLLNYNTWYDLGYFNRYDEQPVIDTIKLYGEELVRKRGVVIDSFLFDDGWDDTSTLWKFHKGLPNEFREIRKVAESYGASPGVWFSPWGGYGQPKDNRIKAAEGKFETNASGFALAGPKYYKHFRDMCLHMIKDNGVNQFKLDGTSGVEAMIPGSKFASDFEAIISLINELRQVKPGLYINLTTGTWASPFWFGIADSIWRGDMDHEFIGEGTQRNKWMTFRDAKIYSNNVAVSPLFPINSLMTHGVIYTKKARDLKTVEGDDLNNEIWSGFGSGTQMQEIYVTPSLLTQAEWDTLANAAKWSRANQKTLVDSHWIGGDPAKLDVYGWASWSPEKGIVTLRNPSSQTRTWSFDPAALFELPAGAASTYTLSSPKGDELPAKQIEAGKTVTLTLKPFQVVVMEAVPAK